MLNGLSLFSGIAGIDLALDPWVRPVAYCENDRYAQAVLLSRMAREQIPIGPIWDDVRSLSASELSEPIDIIYGGSPCQDISVAGAGAGLDGERSGLIFDVFRLISECRPRFVFLENVPALAVRGLDRVLLEFHALGYDARWTIVSAAEVGAPHLRERIWILAHARSERIRILEQRHEGRSDRVQDEGEAIAQHDGKEESLAYADSCGELQSPARGDFERDRTCDGGKEMADANGLRWNERSPRTELSSAEPILDRKEVADSDSEGLEVREQGESRELSATFGRSWWSVEPDLGRVAHGVPARVDRIKCLGNAVVPAAAREAFKRLMGIKEKGTGEWHAST